MTKAKYYTYNNGLFLFAEKEQESAFVECYNRVAQFNGVKNVNPNYKGQTTELQGVYITFEKGFPVTELQLWFNSTKKEHGVAFRQVKRDKKRVFTSTLLKQFGLAFDTSKRVERQNTDRVFVDFAKLDGVLDALQERFKTFQKAEQAKDGAEQANTEQGAA